MQTGINLVTMLSRGIDAMGLQLPASARDSLCEYVALLQRWNAAYNLTAVRDPAAMVTRHLLDSLAIAPFVRGDSLADLGSGAGLPGIPLALLAPRRQVLLVDGNGKKARFLRAAKRELGLDNVSVAESRVESLTGRYDCITTRAFASLSDMLGMGGHLLASDGIWLAMKGRYPEAELAALPRGFRARTDALEVPGMDAQRHVVVIEKVSGESQGTS